jgi:hypothetical protein
MSVIVPAGKNRRDWVPQDSSLVKTASTEEAVEPKDELLEAAKGVLAKQEEEVVVEAAEKCEACGKIAEECECEPEVDAEQKEAGMACGEEECPECDEVEIEVEETEETEEPEEVLEEVKEDGVVTEEEEEVVEEAAVEKIKGAVETIEVALEEVSDAEEALSKVKDAVETVEEVHDEMEDGEEADEVSFTEEVIEDSVEDEPVVASSEEEFCKFAKISPKNRAKIADYWKNSLGYPADYVDLLTKDYEK